MKNRLLNKVLAGMLPLFLLVSITACGSSGNQEQDTSVSAETNTQENDELTAEPKNIGDF